MAMTLAQEIEKLSQVDLFVKNEKSGEFKTGTFVGRPFHIDYERAHLLVADAWKEKVGGIPQGSLLLAYFENEEQISEALLLRVLEPTSLPTDSDVISSMVEYYKDNLRTSGENSQLDTFTAYEFSFSGLDCRILGTFYLDGESRTCFGADVENFYSAHHYSVIKPNQEVLEFIVNFREGDIAGRSEDVRIGKVRYSSSRRFQLQDERVPVYVSPEDFLGKRTALFGMTRTGKSNTVKKVIEATVHMSGRSPGELADYQDGEAEELLDPLTEDGLPKFPVGQIVFDVNGEYANANLQDEGTAIFELFKDEVTRYSVIEKPDFKVMKVNFYGDISSGFELIRSHLDLDGADYVRSFTSVDLTPPSDPQDWSAKTRFDRVRAAYLCCLYRAQFTPPDGFKISFKGNQTLDELVKADGSLKPDNGISLEEATNWFLKIWDSQDNAYFMNYEREKGRPWVDEDLRAMLIFLSRKSKPGGSANLSGYIKIRDMRELHTETVGQPFEEEIIGELRSGRIVIVDLSQGNPEIQRLYSERICRRVFSDAMDRFIGSRPNNFVQFYFEEAHNLFPKKEDKDLSQIYNRLAKEGAKLNLGLVYATQEVSSISANILKNTQNWFIAHLNNEEETREIKKYYDFGDFAESLVRFSASSDKGFVRMKTYSNPFVVPVQVDRFLANEEGAES